MNLHQTVNLMQAAASSTPGVSTPLTKHFKQAGSMLACRLCGAKCKDQKAAADHLMQGHKVLNAGQFAPQDRLNMPKPAGTPGRDPSEYMPGKIQGKKTVQVSALIQQRPGRTYASPRKRIGSVMRPNGLGIAAYGTSEGVSKAWDSRGRKVDAHLNKVSKYASAKGYSNTANRIEDIRDDAHGKQGFTADHAEQLKQLSDHHFDRATTANAANSGWHSKMGSMLNHGAKMIGE